MTATILATTFDCRDPLLVARFWATALGYVIDDSNAPCPQGPKLDRTGALLSSMT